MSGVSASSPDSGVPLPEGRRRVKVYEVSGDHSLVLKGKREVGFPLPGDFGKVLEYASSATLESVTESAREYFFPPGVRVIIPSRRDRACCPPIGYFTVYEDFLRAGFRLPFPSAFNDLLIRVAVPLGQLTPNSFRHLTVLGVEACRAGVALSVDLIARYFSFKRSNGWMYLAPRPGKGVRAKVPGKLSDWQKKFFFCRATSVLDAGWCPPIAPVLRSEVDADPQNRLGELRVLDSDYPEIVLGRAGLSPYRATATGGSGEGFCSLCCLCA